MRAAILTLPAHAVAVPQARRLLHEACEASAIEAGRRPDMDLALTEAFTNAVRHAYPGSTGSIDVVVDAGEAGVVQITVVDHGVGMDHGPSDDPGAGQGLGLMQALSDCEHLPTAGGGTTVHLSFALEGAGHER